MVPSSRLCQPAMPLANLKKFHTPLEMMSKPSSGFSSLLISSLKELINTLKFPVSNCQHLLLPKLHATKVHVFPQKENLIVSFLAAKAKRETGELYSSYSLVIKTNAASKSTFN